MSDRVQANYLSQLKDCAALLSGSLLPLSFSPFDLWPIAFLAPAILFWITFDSDRYRTMWRFYLFNVGMFSVGISWIFVSINAYGGASSLLSGMLVLLFVLTFSLICLPQAWVYAKWLRRNSCATAAAFVGLWVLQEWFRGWFLTGFPWLFLGYGVMETPLVYLAPLFGIFGVSLAACACSICFVLAIRQLRAVFLILPLLIIVLSLASGSFTHTSHQKDITVSLVQGNVDQHTKWLPENRLPILNLYLSASASEWGRDLIVWPEAAVTIFRDDAEAKLDEINRHGTKFGTALVTGIPDVDENGEFQNTVLLLGDGSGQYIKRRLVPFGEYVPLEELLRGLIQFFDLPMSRNKPGPWLQSPLLAGELRLSTSICYEVVYPELVRQSTRAADLLVTVSNDTWFGSSIGPWQHIQMARMRAIENGRSMVRATNNGVTALIDHRGNLQASLPQFEAGVLRGDIEIRTGSTFFNQYGSFPCFALCFFLILAAAFRRDWLFWSDGDVKE